MVERIDFDGSIKSNSSRIRIILRMPLSLRTLIFEWEFDLLWRKSFLSIVTWHPTNFWITKQQPRPRLVGRKTFFRKTIFLYFQFYIVWLTKECKTIFPWGKITFPMMENHFPFKMKGKLFSLSLLYTFLTTSLLSLSFHHFLYMKPNNGKLILELCFPL